MDQLHHLAFRTPQLERLCRFYETLFNWKPVHEQAGYSRWYRLGALTLMIEMAAAGEPPLPTGSGEFFCLRVSVEEKVAFRARLQSLGVALEDATEHTLYFRDPDGRRIGVSSYRFGD